MTQKEILIGNDKTVTARELFINLFETDFLLPDEKETIIKAMELFAKGKCKEQRQICLDQMPPKWKENFTGLILNAPEPIF